MKKLISIKFLFAFVTVGVLALPVALVTMCFSRRKSSDYWWQVSEGYKELCLSIFNTHNLTVRILAPPMMVVALVIGAPMALFFDSRYWHRIWLDFDKFYNAVFDGVHGETISSRLGKSIYHNHEPVFFRHVKYDKIVSWCLNQVDPDHCQKSIMYETGSAV